MNKKLNHILSYIYIPILFIGIGGTLCYFAFHPVVNKVMAITNMAITKGDPDYGKELGELTKEPSFGDHYATISCEDIGLNAPLYYGDTKEIFEKGAGQYIGSGLIGSNRPTLIGGHDSTYFAPLEEIKKGNIINMTTSDGTYKYKVSDIKIGKSSDASLYDLAEEKEKLILYTCYPFGKGYRDNSQRYYVYADRIDNTDKGETGVSHE